MKQGVCFRTIPIRSAPEAHQPATHSGGSAFGGNPTTAIAYHLPAGQAGLSADSRVNLKIFNLLGQEVETLVENEQPAGYHQEIWDASQFSSGAYVYQLSTRDIHGSAVRNLLLSGFRS